MTSCRIWGIVLSIGALLSAGAFAAKSTSQRDEALVKRGEYLVGITGCNDCHTPMVFNQELKMPVPDFSRRLSGHPAGAPDPGGTLGPNDQAVIGPTFTAFRLPFGVVYSANLTPDATGLGNWKAEDFIRTIRSGKHLGTGRQIFPPMPWMDVAQATDDDLRAMFAYLRSLTPIHNEVPQPKVDPKALEEVTQSFAKLAKQQGARK